jgi:hypothetical protein
VKDQRKKALNEYFKGLYHIFNVELLYDERICKFIQIDQSIRNYLAEDYSSFQKNYDDEEDDSSEKSNSADFLAEWSPDTEISSDKIISSFLSKIHKHPENKVNILKTFEESFFNLKITLEVDSIKRLFFGDARNGLIKMAQTNKDSSLAISHIISLISKLLDSKRNVYAESFNKIFATWKPEMIKALNLDEHIMLQNVAEGNDGWFILYNYLSHKNLGGTKIQVDQILHNDEAINLYNEWYENKVSRTNDTDQSKSSKSLIISFNKESPNPFQSTYKESRNEKSAPIKAVNKDGSGSSFLKPINDFNIEEESETIVHDFNNLPSMIKSKSFKTTSINENLKGSRKRFSVMKIIPDEEREEARKTAHSLIESIFLENDDTVQENISKEYKNMKLASREVQVEQEVINLRQYIFTIQACRNCTLNFDDKEESMRVIEKTDDEEIIEIRPKYKKKILSQAQDDEQGEESQKEESKQENEADLLEESELQTISEVKKVTSWIYLIIKIENEENIFIIFQIFDRKTKKFVPNLYKIIAIGEKKWDEEEEFKPEKEDHSKSQDLHHLNDDENSRDNESQSSKPILKISYLEYWEKESEMQSDTETIASILQELVENTRL